MCPVCCEHFEPAAQARDPAAPLLARRAQFLLRRAFTEAVSDAANGLDEIGVAELAAERLDVYVDGAFQNDGPVANGGVHELMARERASRLAEQAFQQAELRWAGGRCAR